MHQEAKITSDRGRFSPRWLAEKGGDRNGSIQGTGLSGATPVSRLSLDRKKMSRARQLGKIVFSLGGLCLSFYSIPGQWSPFNEGPRPRWRGVLAGTGKNLGATGAYVSERADARRPACTCSGMRKEGDRREGEGWPGEARAVVVQKGERRPNTARTKL